MDKISTLNKPKTNIARSTQKDKQNPTTRVVKSTLRKRKNRSKYNNLKRSLLLTTLELLALSIAAIFAIIMLLGYAANQFSGTSFFGNLLPFTIGILAFTLVTLFMLVGWWRLRRWLRLHSDLWTPLISLALALLIAWSVKQDEFTVAYGHFRTLVGGKEEVSRMTISHQVYAAYRRQNLTQLQIMIDRSQLYQIAIDEAANAFKIDVNLLRGIAATESSFIPRDSSDGGRGLFQITRVPQVAINQAAQRLKVAKISLEDPQHNAYIAAATFKHYLSEMKGDLFLALLAYNMGPANGGLRFIMQQYGASDFTTIQPYLQTLPRDYPIRVLSYALAFRLWHKDGKLLAYEEGNNAIYIQKIGIPGLRGDL